MPKSSPETRSGRNSPWRWWDTLSMAAIAALAVAALIIAFLKA